jgi:hypothetical protein
MSKRVLSENQIHTARQNGRKSQGPVSVRGKAASALNAVRHGILSNTVVLDGESTDRFIEHLTALQELFEPSNVVERTLVENMAVCRWRQMRVWGLEKASLTFEVSKQSAANEEIAVNGENDPATRTALAFRTLCDESRSIEALNRYETRFDRQYNRALQSLNELRQKRGIYLAA